MQQRSVLSSDRKSLFCIIMWTWSVDIWNTGGHDPYTCEMQFLYLKEYVVACQSTLNNEIFHK